MKGKEPSSCLIYAFSNEICWVIIVKCFLVFEWIMPLRIRHSARVKPNVNKVCFSLHSLTRIAHQEYIVNIRSMKIKIIFDFFFHYTSSNCFFHFFLKLSDAPDAFQFFSIFRHPYWQRRSPES